MQKGLSLLLSLGFCTLSQEIFLTSATAQVTPDGTTNTTVDVDGSDFTIEQGDRAGGNLFHSFGEFSVPTDGSAFFNNAAEIVNIFSRVTGGNLSNIDGLLRANGSANLFLLNPAGIIFGPNARLDIGGSFFGTTADSFLFEDGEFSALDPDNPPLLTINAPIGLNLRDNPAEIVNRSFVENSAGDFVGLEVTPGNSLTLVGGNINFEAGEATASGGNIELGGLSAAGTVGIGEDGSLNFPENVPRADITLNNAADLDVSGADGGSITINARNLSLEAGDFGGSLIRAGIAADFGFEGAQAGDINVNATGAVNLSGDSSIENQVNGGATGNSGDINVTSESFNLTEGSSLSASTSGQGNAGNVELDIAGEARLVDGNIFSNVESGAVGDGGNISIQAGSLSLLQGAQLQTIIRGIDEEQGLAAGQGNAGNVVIDVDGEVLIELAPSVIEKEPAVILTVFLDPASVIAPELTSLKIFASLDKVTAPVTSIVILPGFPCPEVSLLISPPSSKENEPALIIILPALPIVSDSVLLTIVLGNPSASLPDISTSPSTSMTTFPALP